MKENNIQKALRKNKTIDKPQARKFQKRAVVSRRKKLLSEEAYQLTMNEIDKLMKLGEANLSDAQVKRLRSLSKAAEHYEDTINPLPSPSSLPDIIRVRLFQMGINQTYAATLLGVSDAKFSLIMNGKQKPDIYFVKAVHDKLKVDANKIMQAIF